MPMGSGGKAGLKGLDIIVGMGAKGGGPKPKLGTRTTSPRPMSSKSYRGSMEPNVGGATDDTGGPDEQNAFDDPQSPDAKPDEMLVGAAHDVMSAFHTRDPESLAEALKAFVSMV